MSPLTQIIVVPGGGAIARVDEDATAFGQRTAPLNIHYLSMWADPADTEQNIAYTPDVSRRDEAVVDRAASYLNFIGDEGAGPGRGGVRAGEVRSACASSSRSGTRSNLFRHNQNIPPAS